MKRHGPGLPAAPGPADPSILESNDWSPEKGSLGPRCFGESSSCRFPNRSLIDSDGPLDTIESDGPLHTATPLNVITKLRLPFSLVPGRRFLFGPAVFSSVFSARGQVCAAARDA